MSKAIDDVVEERLRQIAREGWTYEHDDQHSGGELCAAGGCYALYADAYPNQGEPPPAWPWAPEWWKPKDFRRDLVRAAALVIAEIERFDRRPCDHRNATTEFLADLADRNHCPDCGKTSTELPQ